MAENLKKDFKGRDRKNDISSMVYGKVPPQCIDVEECVLGAILLERDRLDIVLDIIPVAEAFYLDAHQRIYRAIQKVNNSGSPVDVVTVTQQLAKSSELELVGGAYFVTRLTMSVISSAHVEAHSRLVLEKYFARELIRITGDAHSKAYDGEEDIFDLLESTEKKVSDIFNSRDQAIQHISREVKNALTRIDMAKNNPGIVTGIPSCIKGLNSRTMGWQDTNLIIVAARPGNGKTALMLADALESAKNGNPAAIFSLEMGMSELTDRMISQESGVDLEKIKKGQLTHGESDSVIKAANFIASLPLYINDRAGMNYLSIRRELIYLKKKVGIEIAFIDYLQLVTCPEMKGKNREAQVSEVSRELKRTAKDLDIPVIALSQMNREGDKGVRPQLSHLRESGAIEQDANIIIFIWHTENATSKQAETFLIIAKNRQGACEDIPVKFIKEKQIWIDRDSDLFSTVQTFVPWDKQFKSKEPEWEEEY